MMAGQFEGALQIPMFQIIDNGFQAPPQGGRVDWV